MQMKKFLEREKKYIWRWDVCTNGNYFIYLIKFTETITKASVFFSNND